MTAVAEGRRPASPRVALVLLAAGSGRRSGHTTNKVLLPLAGTPVVAWSLRWARDLDGLARILLVIREADRDAVSRALADVPDLPDMEVVVGGEARQDSEWHALQALTPDIVAGRVEVVAIHDAARPLAGHALLRAVVDAAAQEGGAVPARPQPALVQRNPADSGADSGAGAPLGSVVTVQTPQAFRAGPLLAAYRQAQADRFQATDTAGCVQRYTDLPVRCVAGDARNVKITFPGDLRLAECLLRGTPGAAPARPRPGIPAG